MAQRLAPKPCVVIDTREKCPFSFDPAKVDTIIDTLATGDYSLWMHTGEVALERKTIDDYVHCLLRERERFFRELERMREYPLRAVIIEASWMDIHEHRYVSRADPASIFAWTCCLMVDYQLPVIMAENHAIASRVAQRMICRWAENLERNCEAALSETGAEAQG